MKQIMILEHVMVWQNVQISFSKEELLKGEGLLVLQERMKTMNPNQKEIFKFLEAEQADGINIKEIYNKVKEEVNRRL